MKKIIQSFLFLTLTHFITVAQELNIVKDVNLVASTVISPFITPEKPWETIFCPNVTNLKMLANPTNVSYTYQWYFSNTENGTYSLISGATASSYTSSVPGYFKVEINDGTLPALSPSHHLRIGAVFSLKTIDDMNSKTISPGSTVSLKTTATGMGPWVYGVTENNNSTKYYSSNNTVSNFNVQTDRYSSYFLREVYDSNGKGCINPGGVSVYVNPPATLTIGTLTSTSVCAGNIIEIPVTYGGTWGDISNVKISATLNNPTTFSQIAGSHIGSLEGNIIKYLIPLGTPDGQYRIRLSGQAPYDVISASEIINVVSSNCTASKAIITGHAYVCEGQINAYPKGNFYTYQWYKNGILIPNATSSSYFVYSNAASNDNYTVNVINTSTGFNATSDPYISNYIYKNAFLVNITSNNICNGNVTLSSTFTGPEYRYQWFKTKAVNDYSNSIPIFQAESSILSVTESGNYFCTVWDGSCSWSSNFLSIYPCPEISCSEDILVPVSAGTTSAVATYNSATSTGNTITRTAGLASGSLFPFGYNEVTFRATNLYNISKTCSFKVVVYDQTAPTVQNSIIPNAIPDVTTGNYSISSALFDVTIPSGETVTGLLISAFPIGAESITINGITYGPPTSGAKLSSNSAELIPFPENGVIATTDIQGKPIDPIIVNPLPNENQINIDYLAINSNNIQSPLPATLTVNFGSAPLPINLISFLGKQFDGNVILSWRTANETNFSHFEVQKSNDAKEFGVIGKVDGNKTEYYNFTDINPIEGQNYYKLKMIDLDGTSSFSKTISINFHKNGNYLLVENPANYGEFVVKSNYASPSFSIVNGLGKKVEMNVSKMDENLYKLSTKDIAPGIYFLMLESRGEVITRKVILE